MRRQGGTWWDVAGHIAAGLIVFATVAILDWLLDASEYPQG